MDNNACLMSGKRCALRAFIGNCFMLSDAVCVDLIILPSGSLTFIPSLVICLLTHSLWICKKWHMVPESVIAMHFFCKTIDAYKYFSFLASTCGFFNSALIYDVDFTSVFNFPSAYELHKLMSSVIVFLHMILWFTLTCGSCQTTKFFFLCNPPLLSTKVASWTYPIAGVLQVLLPWVSWISYPCVWQ